VEERRNENKEQTKKKEGTKGE